MAGKKFGHSEAPEREQVRQVLGIFGGPIAVLASMQAKYLVVPWACGAAAGTIALHVTALAALLLSAFIGLLAFRSWRGAGAGWPDEEGGARGRSRFMGVLGMMLSAISALVIVAQWLPDLMVLPCH
ncbi:MAG TPA: hypothetical protein VHG33_06990 [Woeseiaceae bacterium]|nr:hypothetical protein [Woeseiaceae bacterium]